MHGRKITGIKNAAGRTHTESPYSNWHYMVFYDCESGEAWVKEIYGRNSWCVYDDNDIICIADTQSHMTMQDIADAINEKLNWREYYKVQDERNMEGKA